MPKKAGKKTPKKQKPSPTKKVKDDAAAIVDATDAIVPIQELADEMARMRKRIAKLEGRRL